MATCNSIGPLVLAAGGRPARAPSQLWLQAAAYNSAMQQTATPSAGVQIAHLLRSRPQLMAGSLYALTVP